MLSRPRKMNAGDHNKHRKQGVVNTEKIEERRISYISQ